MKTNEKREILFAQTRVNEDLLDRAERTELPIVILTANTLFIITLWQELRFARGCFGSCLDGKFEKFENSHFDNPNLPDFLVNRSAFRALSTLICG
jgi:hypothetical protein